MDYCEGAAPKADYKAEPNNGPIDFGDDYDPTDQD